MPDLGCVLVLRAPNPHRSAAVQVSWKEYVTSLKVQHLIWRLNSAGYQCCTCLVTRHLVCIDTQAVCCSRAVAALCNEWLT